MPENSAVVGDIVDVGFRCFVGREEDVDVHERPLAILKGDLVDCAASDVLEDLKVRGYAGDAAEEDAAGLELRFTAFTAITAAINIAVGGSNISVVGFGSPGKVSDPWLAASQKLKVWKRR